MYLIGAFITQSVPADQVDHVDFFRSGHRPGDPSAEEALIDGDFVSAGSKNAAGAKELLSFWPARRSSRSTSGSALDLPTSSEVDTSSSPRWCRRASSCCRRRRTSPVFNRDSSDALQTTADAALNKFIDEPNNVDSILKDWQAAASKVFQS